MIHLFSLPVYGRDVAAPSGSRVRTDVSAWGSGGSDREGSALPPIVSPHPFRCRSTPSPEGEGYLRAIFFAKKYPPISRRIYLYI